MKALITVVAAMAFVTAVGAQDLGIQAPPKMPRTYPENIPDPLRQGGDTIFSATVIPALPYNDSGTTAGYTDDYAATCYFSGGAPDVVYQYTAQAGATRLHISLCGSTYDTGLYVYDSGLDQIACNDDFCGLQSQLDIVEVVPGQTYYIIVDGYSSASGTYVLDVQPYVCCIVVCPPEGVPEGEPPLVDDYVDNFNGGCNTPPGYPFQVLSGNDGGEFVLCGVSGWYLNAGSNYRDTDWFTLFAGPSGAIGVTADAEYATYFFELGGTCAGGVNVIQQMVAGPASPATMTISGYAPGATVWFWAGPTVFAPPGQYVEYDYVVWLTGLVPVAAAPTTWGAVKALYD